jgi:hypothetical protein
MRSSTPSWKYASPASGLGTRWAVTSGRRRGGDYEHNARLAGLHRRLAVITHAGFRWDCVCDLGLSELLRSLEVTPIS